VWGAAACDENTRGSKLCETGRRWRLGQTRRRLAAALILERRCRLDADEGLGCVQRRPGRTDIEENDLSVRPARAVERRGCHCCRVVDVWERCRAVKENFQDIY
jgi:hypothetical protein